ncbi:hypothetical protein [Leptolyngbya sp. GGD]|nr:hypothetical protein [Leptolyngbya sp. GGD]MCY6489744.1 hypothetical protein [Leptolyngbya sp. GGD]
MSKGKISDLNDCQHHHLANPAIQATANQPQDPRSYSIEHPRSL